MGHCFEQHEAEKAGQGTAKMNLIFGKCEEKLKSLPDKSVDAVICDPPYRNSWNA